MRRRPSARATLLALPTLLAAGALGAQAAPPAAGAARIAAAVAPLPESMRAGATVLGHPATAARDGALVTLRPGTNGMICLADDPAAEGFHAACYHRGLEAFMARGRALRAAGTKGPAVDSARFREIAAGTLAMPRGGGALYSLTGPAGSVDPATGAVTGARALHVLYLPFATEATTGMSATPTQGRPWLMNPGTPKAHVMFVGEMK